MTIFSISTLQPLYRFAGMPLSVRHIHRSVCLCGQFYESNSVNQHQKGDRELNAEFKKNRNLWRFKGGLKALRMQILLRMKWKNIFKERMESDSRLCLDIAGRERIKKVGDKEKLKLFVLNDKSNSRGFHSYHLGMNLKKLPFNGFINLGLPRNASIDYCCMKSKTTLALLGQAQGNPDPMENRNRFRDANRNIKEKSQTILRDFKETKQQMRERVGVMMTRENVWTIPNALCLMRMGMAPVAAYLILTNQYGPAIGVFAVAGVSDLLDGWIARVFPSQASVMGSFLDPMADKILVGTLFVSLTYMDLIPVPLTALIIGRDAILIAAGFYIRYQSLEPPRTLSRYFNVTHPTAQLAPTFLSKINTGIQLGLVGATLLSTIITYDTHNLLQILWYTTATTTIASAVGYLFAKDTVKFLRRKPSKNKIDNDKKL